MARDFILEILGLARHHPILDDTDNQKLPKDIRTTLKNLNINPELEKKICCPQCFTLYDLINAPWRCMYKKSPMARVCDEELFELKTTYRGIRDHGTTQKYPSILKDLPPSEVGYPRNVYVTQRLSLWLSWFLSKSTTKADISNWSDEVTSSTKEKIFDIQQSTAWKDVTWPTPPSTGPEPLNLVFSLFVDWFNPRGNTQRGAQQSMGVLAFNCLNLPPSSRNLIHNTCVAGITPGPNSPDMTTISHVLEGLVDDLLLLERGILIKTQQFPDGRLVRVKLLSLLGDTVGMRKVAGFASHSATLYCSWCWAKSDDITDMLIGKLRTKDEVIAAQNKSKATLTLNNKEILFKETGVRWSEMAQLEYRDPVNHLPLGMMHNWFEGMLQQHFRYRWGFVLYTKDQKQKMNQKRARGQQESNRGQRESKRVMYEEGGGNACDQDENMIEDSDSSEEEIDEIELAAGWDGGLMSKEDIDFFWKRLRDVVLPTGMTRLPSKLGEASAGTLKAAQWHSLFSYVIPLIIPEMYAKNVNQVDKKSNSGKILLNIGALCQCTNIVCAKKVSEEDAKEFEFYYKNYHETSKEIFASLSIKPNHHYALHIPDALRRWGPLNAVAEFAGERLIGVLQKIPTNTRLAQMDSTMMTRFAQWQRMLSDHGTLIEGILHPVKTEKQRDPSRSRMRIKLHKEQYEVLLGYLQGLDNSIRDYCHMPHPLNSPILQPYAIPRARWRISSNLLISAMKPNNCIKYTQKGHSNYALVRQIYEFSNPQQQWQTVLLVNPIRNLYPKDLQSPSRHFRYILFLLKCVVGEIQPLCIIVPPEAVTCVASYRLLPNKTFAIQDGGIILRPYDYKSQLDAL